MRTTLLGTVTVAILACASPSLAQSDSDTARDELKKGYELKKAGRCDEAIPHLETSVRLDPEIKALANLSECEEQVGKLVLAHKHWGEVKQLAGVASNNAIKADAEKHANTIHARLPKLIVHLAPGAPSDTQVTADETPLSAAALAAPILIDPGAHVIMVRAQGHDDQSVSVTLVEGEQKEILVHVGPSNAPPPAAEVSPQTAPPPAPITTAATPPPAPPPPTTPFPPPTGPAPEPQAGSSGSGQFIGGIVAGGAGVVGLGLGVAYTAMAASKWSQAKTDCGAGCGPTLVAQSEKSEASNEATIATVAVTAGAVALAAGIVLVLTAPSGHGREIRVVPTVGPTSSGLLLRGTF